MNSENQQLTRNCLPSSPVHTKNKHDPQVDTHLVVVGFTNKNNKTRNVRKKCQDVAKTAANNKEIESISPRNKYQPDIEDMILDSWHIVLAVQYRKCHICDTHYDASNRVFDQGVITVIAYRIAIGSYIGLLWTAIRAYCLFKVLEEYMIKWMVDAEPEDYVMLLNDPKLAGYSVIVGNG